MHALLFGFAALIVVLFAVHSFARANTLRLAFQMRRGAGVILIAIALLLLLRGASGYALPIATFALWLLLGPSRASSPPGSAGGQTSHVRTTYIEMELDHESGSMCGRVLKGEYQGREFDAMKPGELARLWQECQFEDPQSAQLIEAYLDRVHATWREDFARAGSGRSEAGGRGGARTAGGGGRPGGGVMGVREAYDILGLRPGASSEDIRQAHRELMKKLHPDRGGSDYLATKINEAKDLLLGEGRTGPQRKN